MHEKLSTLSSHTKTVVIFGEWPLQAFCEFIAWCRGAAVLASAHDENTAAADCPVPNVLYCTCSTRRECTHSDILEQCTCALLDKHTLFFARCTALLKRLKGAFDSPSRVCAGEAQIIGSTTEATTICFTGVTVVGHAGCWGKERALFTLPPLSLPTSLLTFSSQLVLLTQHDTPSLTRAGGCAGLPRCWSVSWNGQGRQEGHGRSV